MKLFQSLCLSVGLWACEGDDASRTAYYREFLNRPAGTLIVQELAGTPTKLEDELDGRPVLLNLWATWCPPCLKEMPDLNALAAEGKFKVIAVSIDSRVEPVKAYVAKNAAHFSHIKVLYDEDGAAQRPLLGGYQYPTTYLLNEQGYVQRIYTGPRPWATEKVQKQLLDALTTPID